jgi:putative copper export protein
VASLWQTSYGKALLAKILLLGGTMLAATRVGAIVGFADRRAEADHREHAPTRSHYLSSLRPCDHR